MNQKSINQKSYYYYYYIAFLLCILGIIDTAYLTVSHYKNFTDPIYSSFCAISDAINCDTVSQSEWSILFGAPVATWGILGYTLFAFFLFQVRDAAKSTIYLWNILFILSVIYSGAAIYFGYVSATKIKSYCILCIFSYTISFSLLLICIFILKRFNCGLLFSGFLKSVTFCITKQSSLSFKSILALVFLLIFIIPLNYPKYWQYSSPLTDDMQTGRTAAGHPWIGSATPILTIEEYSDYQCFQCKKMHYMLRNLIAKYPGKIKLIHHNYPLDHEYNNIIVPTPFHIGSGKMAKLAIYANHKDRFWEMNDLLYKIAGNNEDFNTKTISEKINITSGELTWALSNSQVEKLLLRDIRLGMKLRIMETPTFLIDGNKYIGNIPPDILSRVLD